MGNHTEAQRLPAALPRIFLGIWGAAATFAALIWTIMIAPETALLAGLKYHRPVAFLSRLWGAGICKICAVRVEIEGLENLAGLKSYVLVSNHQSFFDIFAILGFMPGATLFVAKKELLKIPLIGYAIREQGHIIIDRQNGGRTIRKAIEQARGGSPICVFAEGHRYNDGRLHDFEDGAAWLATMAKLPCVPMAINGSGAIFPRKAMVVVPGRTIRFSLLPPISTEQLKSSDRSELTRKLEDAVRSKFVAEL